MKKSWFRIFCILMVKILLPNGLSAADAPFPGEVSFGKPDAPIIIHEYSSLSCAHCAEFHETVFLRLKKEFIDTGHVRLIFRHFPLDNQAALAAAILMNVPAIKQPAVLAKFFETRARWMEDKDPAKVFAEISGLSPEACKKILADKPAVDSILKGRLIAEKQLKIDGTPTFIINGRIIDHAPSWDELKKHLRK